MTSSTAHVHSIWGHGFSMVFPPCYGQNVLPILCTQSIQSAGIGASIHQGNSDAYLTPAELQRGQRNRVGAHCLSDNAVSVIVPSFGYRSTGSLGVRSLTHTQIPAIADGFRCFPCLHYGTLIPVARIG